MSTEVKAGVAVDKGVGDEDDHNPPSAQNEDEENCKSGSVGGMRREEAISGGMEAVDEAEQALQVGTEKRTGTRHEGFDEEFVYSRRTKNAHYGAGDNGKCCPTGIATKNIENKNEV